MSRFLLALFCLIFSLGPSFALKVYLLSNHANVGDHNQALGVAKYLSAQTIDIDVGRVSADNIREQITNDLQQEKIVVIGAGEGGITGIRELSSNPNLIIGLISHTYLPSYDDDNLLNRVNFVALPQHLPEADKEKVKSKLIEVTGVPHNREPKVAEQTFHEWKQELPHCDRYMGVMLGGDAPTPSKEINLFTKNDAEQLAKYVLEHAKDECILVLNGPRTGKHDNTKREIPTAHRDRYLDHITQHFVDLMTDKLGAHKVKVLDFQFNDKPPYNSFDLVVGAVNATGGYMLIPGESTSMVSEAIDILRPGHVYIYTNNAMNDVHAAHVKSEFEANRASIIVDYKSLQSLGTPTSTNSISAAEAIARKFMEEINTSI